MPNFEFWKKKKKKKKEIYHQFIINWISPESGKGLVEYIWLAQDPTWLDSDETLKQKIWLFLDDCFAD